MIDNFQYVGSGFGQDADTDQFAAPPAVTVGCPLMAPPHFSHILQIHGQTVSLGNDGSTDLLQVRELAECAYDVGAFLFPDFTAGRVFVSGTQCAAQIVDGQLPGGQLLRIDDHLQFFFLTAEQERIGHSRNAVELRLDRVFHKPSQLADVGYWNQLIDLGMLIAKGVQPVQQQIPLVGLQ